jgi:hypothetical protein
VCLQQEHLKLGFCLQQGTWAHSQFRVPQSQFGANGPGLVEHGPGLEGLHPPFPRVSYQGKIEKGAILLS